METAGEINLSGCPLSQPNPSRILSRLHSSEPSCSPTSPSNVSDSILSHWDTLSACACRSRIVKTVAFRLNTPVSALTSQSFNTPTQPMLRS